MNEVRTRLGNLATRWNAVLREGGASLFARVAGWRTRQVSPREREGWRAIWRGARGPLAYAAAYLLAQYASAVLAFALSPKVEGPSPLHLPSGVAVAALLLAPRRRWWLYLLVTIPVLFLDVWLLGLPLSEAVWQTLFLIIVIIVCISVFTVSLLRRYMTLPLRFASVSEVTRFMICACVGAVPAAVIAASGRIFIFSWDFWLSWQIGLLGYVLGIVAFTPVIVLWLTYGTRGLELGTHGRRVECALLGVATLVVGSLIFGTRLEDQVVAHALIYIMVPLLIWAAVRFGSQGLASTIALATAIAVTGAAYNRGPFVGSTAVSNEVALQLYILFVGVPMYFLASLVQERRQAERALLASEHRYRLVVRNLPNTAVLLFDAERRHRFAEGPGLAQIGLTPQNVEGLTPSDAFPANLVAALAPSYEAALSNQAGALDLEHARHTVHVQAVPLPNDSSGSGAVDAVSAGSSPVGMMVLQDVTEQRRARDELESERLLAASLRTVNQVFRTLAEHSPDVIVRLDRSGRILYLNEAGTYLLGQPAWHWVGKTVADLGVRELITERWAQRLRDVVVTRAPATFDEDVVALDGQVHALHIRLVPEQAEGTEDAGKGALQSVLVIATDVSALKQAEARLAAQASELTAIFESQADGVSVFDLAGRYMRANRALRDLLGLDADAEYTSLPIAERTQRLRLYDEQGQLLPVEQWPQQRVLRGEILTGASAMEVRVRTLDGRDLWVSITGAPVRSADGQATGVVLVSRDVTARRQLAHEVREQASQLEAIFDAHADGVAVFDMQGHCVRANPALRQLMGSGAGDEHSLSRNDEQAQQLVLLDEHGLPLPQDQWPLWRVLSGEVLAGSDAVETNARTPDGHEVWISTTGAPIRSTDGQITGAVLIARDVGARRALEQQLSEQTSQLEAIFDAIADGIGVFDLQGRFLRANPALRQMEGFPNDADYSTRPLAGRAQRLVIFDEQGHRLAADQWPHWRPLRGETFAGAQALDLRLQTLDGRELWASVTGAPVRAPDGQITGGVLILRDVGFRRTLEQRVAAQASELAAIFEALADGVVVYDKDGRMVRANRTWQAMFRAMAERTDLSADPAFATLPATDQEEWWHQSVRSKQNVLHDAHGRPIPLEETPTYRALHGEIVTGAGAVDEGFHTMEGNHYIMSVSAAPLRDGEGAIVGAVSVVREVTAQRQLERQVREQAAQLEAIFAAMTDGVFVLDSQGEMIRVNPAAQDLFKLVTGEDRELEAIDRTPEARARALDLGDSTGRSLSAAALPTARLLSGEVLTGETALTLQFGSHSGYPRTISLTGGPIRDEANGRIVGAVGVVRDVTELQRVQAALTEQERLFRTLVEHSPDIIARFDRQLRYRYVNPAIRQISPLPEIAYVGKTNAELGFPEAAYASAHQAIEQTFRTGRPQIVEMSETTHTSDPASNRSFRAQFLPERGDDGRVESVLTVTTDITPLKRTEQALREAVGRLEMSRQQEARRKQIAESLREVLAFLNSTRSPRDVLQYIVHQAAGLLDAAAAAIYAPRRMTESAASEVSTGPKPGATTSSGRLDAPADAKAEALGVQAVEGLRIGGRKVHLGQSLPVAHAAVEQALTSAQPVAVVVGHSGHGRRTSRSRGVSDGKASARRTAYSHLDAKLPAPYHALLVIPIRVHDGIYGCLLLLHHKSHTFTDEEVALSQTYADQVAMAITNARLRSHLAQEAAAAERNRLAQELHDTVKQELFSASLVAQSLPAVWRTHRAEAEAGLHTLRTAAQSAYAGLQALLLELRPSALEQMSLSESLRQLSAAMNARAGVPIAVDVLEAGEVATDRATPEPPLPTEVKVACYRIAQEALMNAAKYARAHSIRIRLRTARAKGATRLELEIADDGVGFDPTSVPPTHYGLAIMHERAQSVGARVRIHSHIGQGTVVNLIWQGKLKSTASHYADHDTSEASIRGGPYEQVGSRARR